MTIDCAFYGFCAADADARTSKPASHGFGCASVSAAMTICNGCKSTCSAPPPRPPQR